MIKKTGFSHRSQVIEFGVLALCTKLGNQSKSPVHIQKFKTRFRTGKTKMASTGLPSTPIGLAVFYMLRGFLDQVAQHIRQNAAIVEILYFIKRIDAAQKFNILCVAVGASDRQCDGHAWLEAA